MFGALLVRRIRPWSERKAARPRDCALPLTEDQVARAYRGIDGEPWLEALSIDPGPGDGLAELSRWDELQRRAAELTATEIFDVVAVSRGEPLPGFTWLGYDVGNLSAYGVYSSLIHESVYGAIDALRAHAANLNSALLLPGRAELDAYLATRARLLAAGADVEAGCTIEVLAIWGRT